MERPCSSTSVIRTIKSVPAVAGNIKSDCQLTGDNTGLCKWLCGVGKHILPPLHTGIILWYLQLIFRHIHDMDGRIFGIVHIAIPAFTGRRLKAQTPLSAAGSRPLDIAQIGIPTVPSLHGWAAIQFKVSSPSSIS